MNQSAHGTVWQRNQRTIHQRTSVDTISPLYILSSEHFDFQGCPLIFPSILTSQSDHNQINLFYAFAANFSFQGEENDKGRRRLVISNKLKCWNGLLILMQSRPIQSSQVFWGAAKQSSVLLLLMLMLMLLLLLLLQCFAT